MIKIGNKKISTNGPIYIIAEMACAHDGEVEKAKQLVDAAVEAKVDAIQLQFFSVKDNTSPKVEGYDLGIQIEFTKDQWQEIFDYSRSFDIQIFACTFDVPSVKLAIQLGVDGIKINSSDLSHPDLLEIVGQSGLPFTLGTGASTIQEIAQAVETLLENGGHQIVVMHGIQNFPTDIHDAHINRVKMLKSLFPFLVGYHDHTDADLSFSRTVDLLAIGAGACVIEKHITLDRSKKGLDYQSALEPQELKEFVEMIRMAENAMGANRILPLSESEKQYRRFQKKSIVAIRDMGAGEILKRKDIAFMRAPKIGLSPVDASGIIGRTLVRSVIRYEPLFWEYFRE